MSEPIRILIVEDQPTDAELAQREIRKALNPCTFQRVETRDDFLKALEAFQPDLIITDYRMPRFDGLTALKLAMDRTPLTPMIILTGAMNEDTAVECMKAGAADYVIKEHIKRLSQAVLHALEEKKIRQERRSAAQALRESEARYRTLIQTVPDPIAVMDLSGRLTYVSPAWISLHEYQEPSDVLGEKVIRWIHVNYHEKFWAALERVKAGETMRGQEYAVVTKSGSTVFVESSLSCIRDDYGNAISQVAVLRDISERKRAEEERAQLQSQLLQAQKMESIGRLAGGVAHDFNNMLSVILGYTELLQSQLSSDDSMISDVMQIERAGRRAKEITQQLLAFSRKQIIEPAVLDLNSLITSTQKALVRLIGEDIDLQFSPEPNLHNIRFDHSQLDQILINLAVNARDAMPQGGKLIIQTGNVNLDGEFAREHLGFSPGEYVLLTITDTGIGMDLETRSHAFEPFFTTKAVGKGTGLGLATVYGIVTQGGGFIELFSEPGEGSTFKIYFPRATDEEEAPENDNLELTVKPGTGTVLVVEDDVMVRDMAVAMLKASGYRVVAATTPTNALKYCREDNPVDLLITDVVMPELSGAALKDKVLEIRPGIKVLFISGYAGDIIAHHGVLDEGINFIRKPFSMSDLASAVQNAMQR